MITHTIASTTLNAAHETTPPVSCITNSVVTNFTVSALLAVDAAPAIVDIVGEAGPFASIASAPLINLGTSTPEQRETARQVVRAAHDAGVPWVLDPVAAGALVYRAALAHELPDFEPTVIRGNAPGITTLTGTSIGGRGVDAANEVNATLDAARALAQKVEYVVAIPGIVGAIVSVSEILRVGGGTGMLTRVIGGGCALNVVGAAFVSMGRTKGLEDLESIAAYHIAYSAAAERTESQAAKLGTFAPLLLSALYSPEGAELKRIPLP